MPQRGETVGDQPDALERPEPELAVVLVAGGDREGERVEQDVVGRDAVPVDGEVVQALGDLELSLWRLGHALFVDGQRDYASPEATAQRTYFVEASLSVFEVDRVDEALAADPLERGFEDGHLGRVDDQRPVHGGRHFGDQRIHIEDLGAADESGADVDGVRA